MHTASYEFLMKPKESAGCHQTLSARVGSGDETRRPGESYHVIPATGDVTDSRHGDIFTFISPATEKLKKQDKFQPRDKS